VRFFTEIGSDLQKHRQANVLDLAQWSELRPGFAGVYDQ
jgi:hypothetical protein